MTTSAPEAYRRSIREIADAVAPGWERWRAHRDDDHPGPRVEGDPGPFSLDDPERVRGLLEGAGFAEARAEEVAVHFDFRDVDECLAFAADTPGPMICARSASERPWSTTAIVVLAAGTLGTPRLLFANQRRLKGLSPALGSRFSGNSDALGIAFDPQNADVRGARNDFGPVMTSKLDYTADRRLIVADGRCPR